jgi:hypothetical protein
MNLRGLFYPVENRISESSTGREIRQQAVHVASELQWKKLLADSMKKLMSLFCHNLLVALARATRMKSFSGVSTDYPFYPSLIPLLQDDKPVLIHHGRPSPELVCLLSLPRSRLRFGFQGNLLSTERFVSRG